MGCRVAVCGAFRARIKARPNCRNGRLDHVGAQAYCAHLPDLKCHMDSRLCIYGWRVRFLFIGKKIHVCGYNLCIGFSVRFSVENFCVFSAFSKVCISSFIYLVRLSYLNPGLLSLHKMTCRGMRTEIYIIKN